MTSRTGMTTPIDVAFISLSRTEPGPGASLDDDGGPEHIRTRSIPNVSSARLWRCLWAIHGQYHTTEGLRLFDSPRRTMIEQGIKGKAIAHELRLRGLTVKDGCGLCWDPPLSASGT